MDDDDELLGGQCRWNTTMAYQKGCLTRRIAVPSVWRDSTLISVWSSTPATIYHFTVGPQTPLRRRGIKSGVFPVLIGRPLWQLFFMHFRARLFPSLRVRVLHAPAERSADCFAHCWDHAGLRGLFLLRSRPGKARATQRPRTPG